MPVMRVFATCLFILILYYLIAVKRLRLFPRILTDYSNSSTQKLGFVKSRPFFGHKDFHDKHLMAKKNKTKINFANMTSKEIDEYMYGKPVTRVPPYQRVPFTPVKMPDYFRKSIDLQGVDCETLLRGTKRQRKKMQKIALRFKSKEILPKTYLEMTSNCLRFKHNRQYITDHLTAEERSFPVAFSIVMHASVYQFEALLRAIYRPQNYYCVHVDKKAGNMTKMAVLSISGCFSNVMYVNDQEDVYRGHLSLIHAHLKCARMLLLKPKWKYFINLSGEEFPLKTNYEIIKVLKILNGSNDVEGIPIRHTNGKLVHPPNGLFGFGGSPSVLLNRRTVSFAARSPLANSILAWTYRRPFGFMNFFATINYNPRLKLPGTYEGPIKTNHLQKQHHITQFSVSLTNKRKRHRKRCHGKMERGYCLFGVKDLPRLARHKELFVHRLRWNYQDATMRCLEHDIHKRSKMQYVYPRYFDVSWYKNLTFIKYSKH